MNLAIIEASNGFNHGKFGVAAHTRQQWQHAGALPEEPMGGRLLARLGWSRRHLWVLDLQTGEGAMFLHGGLASADLNKHKIWVCPLFEPFLAWLYTQRLPDDLTLVDVWIQSLPAYVELPDAPADMHGYRRPGPQEPREPHTDSPADRKSVPS